MIIELFVNKSCFLTGHAEYELGRLKEAASTFKIGLQYEPNNNILKERL